MMRDELKDRAISLLKDTYAIGYEDGVKATNVDCGVVWEERIDAIRDEIEEKRDLLMQQGGVCEHSAYGLDYAILIINAHCGGENE